MARKILLADDSVTAQNMGRKILADAGYEVITVNNGSAALKRIAEQKPDLIVLDVYMPGYSGLEVCQRLKETGDTSRIPVLLTVGKLEPFKPEEAKRARADAYIVKPFEASELLSALTKLEDKIVPRAEGSKPGRFARSIAAIEEGRYDKTTAAEDDSGWKNRINFPHKKEKAAEKEDGDDPAIYNAVNKDLRTTVDHSRPAETKAETKKEDSRVDLGALAPAGLPKDVTPEEIAALAAAAAQVQNSLAVGKDTETAEPASASSVQSAEHAQELKAEPAAVAKVEPSEPAPQETSVPLTPSVESRAEEKPAEKFEAEAKEPAEKDAVHRADEALVPVVSAAIVPPANSGNGAGPYAEQPAEEPVTMAVASGVVGTAASRWVAVNVALAPEESSLSLEMEMQKAHAAFAAAEGASTRSAVAVLEPPSSVGSEAAKAPEISSPESAVYATQDKPEEKVAEQPASSTADEAAQMLPAVASAATETIDAAIGELETKAVSLEPAMPESSATQEANPEFTISPAPADVALAAAEPKSGIAESAPQQAPDQPSHEHEPVAAAAEPAAEDSKVAEPEVRAQFHTDENQATPETETAALHQPAHGGSEEMGKKESDIAATTAAAWASWRRIRESKDSKSGQNSKETSDDAAAMAVAAGAEHKPEEVKSGDESDPEIANIVDSVLADMRPKIVEEISRKLGKKK